MYNTEITERFILENSIAQSKKMASIGQIVSGITHELRNPIGVIKGANYLISDILRAKNFDDREELEELSNQIEESVKYSENTISNLLDFSRVSARNNENINLLKIIDQILILEMNNILKNGVQIVKKYDEREVLVKGNTDSLKHIFFNIISNGIQAVPIGEGILELSFERIGKDLAFSVKDNGIGIDEAMKEYIFEPFVTTKGNAGYGLGLWVVKNELEKMDGKIEIKKGLGSVSNFVIYLRT